MKTIHIELTSANHYLFIFIYYLTLKFLFTVQFLILDQQVKNY